MDSTAAARMQISATHVIREAHPANTILSSCSHKCLPIGGASYYF